MKWIIVATAINTVWTLWCALRAPDRLATRFGPSGQPEGSMSRRGFTLFFLLFPLATAAFVVYIGKLSHTVAGMPTAMNHFAAGMILFFSLLSWCIMRSNRNSPARIDVPSLLLSIVGLMVVMFLSFRDLSTTSAKPKSSPEAPIIAPN